jgi:hypothetical protein
VVHRPVEVKDQIAISGASAGPDRQPPALRRREQDRDGAGHGAAAGSAAAAASTMPATVSSSTALLRARHASNPTTTPTGRGSGDRLDLALQIDGPVYADHQLHL